MRGGRIERQNQISEKRLEQSRGRRKRTFILGGDVTAAASGRKQTVKFAQFDVIECPLFPKAVIQNVKESRI